MCSSRENRGDHVCAAAEKIGETPQPRVQRKNISEEARKIYRVKGRGGVVLFAICHTIDSYHSPYFSLMDFFHSRMLALHVLQILIMGCFVACSRVCLLLGRCRCMVLGPALICLFFFWHVLYKLKRRAGTASSVSFVIVPLSFLLILEQSQRKQERRSRLGRFDLCPRDEEDGW